MELLKGKGPLTSTGIESLLYMKSNISTNPDPSVADIELLQSFATVAFDTGLKFTSFYLFFYQKSKINFNFYSSWYARRCWINRRSIRSNFQTPGKSQSLSSVAASIASTE